MRDRAMRRSSNAILIATAVALLLLVVIRESYAPRLTLHLRDRLGQPPSVVGTELGEDLHVRLYSTSRPYVGKIAALQKGLVLSYKGQELIEEGYGFGLPIIEVEGVAHIARHAKTSMGLQAGRHTLVKTYLIDVVDRPTRPFRVKYADVEPLGTVVFSYTLHTPDTIDVTADFRGLKTAWDRAYVMNEQGAHAFTRYVDGAGHELDAKEVGIWEATTAPFGCWEAPDLGVRFCVEATPGQEGFVGRERYRQYNWLGFYTLSWSGIDIALDAPLDTYSYTIRVQDGINQ